MTRLSIRRALEAEAAFGVTELPRGRRLDEVAAPSLRTQPMATGPSEDRNLAGVAERIASCRTCDLCETRTNTVPGQGSDQARLMFIGEAPGEQEDLSGQAFVGPAGQLLTKMIEAMGLSRDEVFIANILKCRPPQNRDPKPEEVNACFHFLKEQLDLIQPEIICTLGAHATNSLLEKDEPMYKLRGRVFDHHGIQVVPTYHPSYLLRTPAAKKKSWADLQVVMGLIATK